MSTITQTAASTAAATSSPASTKLNVDFNMFLKMLTTQMQNQDPLSPMDTSQYTQQLVQYSQVEQSIQQNKTLNSILSSLSGQNLTQASGLIGRQVIFDSAVAGLSADTPASWNYAANGKVSSLVATVTAADGTVVDTRAVDATGAAGRFSWDGKLTDGTTAAPGSYTLTLRGSDASGNNVPVTVNSVGTVREVQMAGGALSLSVNGSVYPATSLLSIAG